ncbi:hypothetical protein ACT3UD_05905 [Glutamicibacter sp. 287]|uniref:hypothetical protein n=1 Tax=unclassified Glutamicibacter TaxID=2627139 RepID=UPI000BD2A433|nr:hypothetical protein [Glutamicibacter sp. BW80]PCC30522.1 hypothetical protein CIK76_00555 [Glutamicibacter sp. BW80]
MSAEPSAMQVSYPENCGNAPRHLVIQEVIVALHGRDLDHLRLWLTEDIEWEIVGFETLHGIDALCSWVMISGDTKSLEFKSVLTHGREGSTDGNITNGQDISAAFSHVLRFTGAAKTARIKSARSYLVSKPI